MVGDIINMLCCILNPVGNYLGHPICQSCLNSFKIVNHDKWDRKYAAPTGREILMAVSPYEAAWRNDYVLVRSKEVDKWLKSWRQPTIPKQSSPNII